MILINIFHIGGIVVGQEVIAKHVEKIMVSDNEDAKEYITEEEFVENAMKVPIMKVCLDCHYSSCICPCGCME